jgi:hypothetical protein
MPYEKGGVRSAEDATLPELTCQALSRDPPIK